MTEAGSIISTPSAPKLDARGFTVCSLGMLILLALTKAISTYGNTPAALYLLLPAAVCLLLMRFGSRSWAFPTLVATIVLVVAAAAANLVPDPTWDGNMYHKPAIVALHNGWNPWNFPEFNDWAKTRTETYFSAAVWQNNENSLWMSHYPNLSWLVGAALMDFGLGWESGKAFSWLLAFSLFLYSRAVLLHYIANRNLVTLLSLLVVLCAPLLVQLPTNYVDGATYTAVALIIFSFLDPEKSVSVNVIAWCGLIILAGLKFTGALYAALLALPFLALRRPRLKEIFAWAALGALLLSHPYLNHIASGVDIAYPLTDNSRVLRGQVEQKLLDKSRVSALATSLFSNTSNSLTDPGLKVPGTIHPGEIAAAGSPDTRHAGFGPLFSLAWLISVVAAIVALMPSFRARRLERRQLMLLGVAGLVLVLTLIHAAPWWARYVPFFYLGSIMMLALAVSSPLRSARALGAAGLLVILLNASLVAWGSMIYVRDYSLRPGFFADRSLVRNYDRNDIILIRAPEFIAFSAIYHLQESLGFQQVQYQPAPLDALNCTNSQDLGLWIGLAKICKQSGELR